ncbi:MAG: Fur family transcriptional regulator [Bdellovibrionales bacterium]
MSLNLEKLCADAGLKLTNPRKAILKVLEDAQDHPSVEEIYQRASEIDSSVSMATVYRTVSMLHEMDILVRHDFNESFARYELNDNHHEHIVDIDTGEIIEFHNEELEALKEKIVNDMGYDLVDHRLELYVKKRQKT